MLQTCGGPPPEDNGDPLYEIVRNIGTSIDFEVENNKVIVSNCKQENLYFIFHNNFS